MKVTIGSMTSLGRLCVCLALLALPAGIATAASGTVYDVVITGGRVIDPETSTDAVLNVGVTGGSIAAVSAEPLQGRQTIDAHGLVVAPGFIDLHQHAQDEASGRLKALDGVTSALEMEIGVPDVQAFLRSKQGRALINYGTSASHAAARALAFDAPIAAPNIIPPSGPSTNMPASPEQLAKLQQRLRSELAAGALAVGMGLQYTPGATRAEVIETFRLAAQQHVPVFTHVRSAGRVEPGSSIEAVSEVIGAAAISGASLHVVHVNSSCQRDAVECVSMIAGARARGLDVTTEAYPYTAGMTEINSALFNAGWREKFGIDYDSLVLPDTGEKLTRERFEELHASPKPQAVLLYLNKQEVVDTVIAEPLVMIASDGEDGHPRNAGTYCRILSRYVRELRTVTLTDAIRKMSLMPAQRLERSTPEARRKGRLQVGSDADVVIFDPKAVRDEATYQAPRKPSVGMAYVLVGGTVVVDHGHIVENKFPGRAIVRTPL